MSPPPKGPGVQPGTKQGEETEKADNREIEKAEQKARQERAEVRGSPEEQTGDYRSLGHNRRGKRSHEA